MKEVNISEVSSRQLLITCSMSQCTSEHVSNPTRNVSAMLDSNIAMHLFNISSPLYLRKEKISIVEKGHYNYHNITQSLRCFMVWCLLPGFSVYIYDGDMLSPGSRAGAGDLPRAGHGQAWPATGPRGHELVLQQQHFLIQLRDEWLCFISCYCENNTVKSPLTLSPMFLILAIVVKLSHIIWQRQ